IKGIFFVAIDQSKPLSDQGPFDVVMHKLLGKEWRQIIESARSFLHLESFLNILRSRPQGSSEDVSSPLAILLICSAEWEMA
ncbi:inositol-tetrakisphosphate 1-kinase 2, partial [Quercus suber]